MMSQYPVVDERPISAIDALKDNWPNFKDTLPLALGVPALLCIVPSVLTLIPMAIVGVVLGISAATKNDSLAFGLIPVAVLFILLFAAIYNAIRVGWVNITLKLARGEDCSLGDLKESLPWFKDFFLLNFAVGLLTLLGSILFLAPGIFVAVRCAFAPLLIIDENLAPMEAIRRSNELVKGQSWQVLLYFVAYGLTNTIGSMVPIIGMISPIATMGYFDMTLARIYYLRK